MERSEFEKLIAESNLDLVLSMGYEPRFIVSFQAETQFGIRCQSDTLGFDEDKNVSPRQAFQSMTIDQARAYISACEERLQKAAQTKSGEPNYPDVQQPTSPQKVVTAQTRTFNYPAH